MSKIDAVRHYGRNTQHQDEGQIWVTSEWIVGTFAGRGFRGKTFEQAAHHLIDYLDDHIAHDSIVGQSVRGARWTGGDSVLLNEAALLFQAPTAPHTADSDPDLQGD